MREYLDQPLRPPAGLLQKTHSRARLVAVVLALSVGSLHSGRGADSNGTRARWSLAPVPADSVSPAGGEAKVPAVARRLWRGLLCICPEKDCVHESLDACTCPYAEKRRSEILDEVKRRGFGSTKQDDATYATAFANYTLRATPAYREHPHRRRAAKPTQKEHPKATIGQEIPNE